MNVLEPTTTADGNTILGHLLGSKDVSRQVAIGAMLGGLLDRDGDGGIMDDVAGMMGGFLKGKA